MTQKKLSPIKVGLIANIFEWYEFAVYGYLAGVMGTLFFNAKDSVVAVLSAFLLFSISFLMRPIGSLFFGYMGDKYGRIKSLNLSLLLMSIPTFLIGFLPTYDNIGYTAVFMLVFLRMVQGFSTGGELPISACYVYESSSAKNKGLFCGIVNVSALIGVIFGSLVAALLYLLFDQKQILAYAWRIPFLLGIPITLLIFYARRNIKEIHLKEYVKSQSTLVRKMVVPFFLVAFIQICFYTMFMWLPSYLQYFLHVPAGICKASNLTALLALAIFTVLSGYISYFISFKKIFIFGVGAIAISIYPFFLLLAQGSIFMIFSVQIAFSLCQGCINGVIFRILGDIFSDTNRCRGLSISFTLPTAFLGGTAPTFCGYLIYKTGITTFPAFYIIFFGIISLLAALYLNGTRQQDSWIESGSASLSG